MKKDKLVVNSTSSISIPEIEYISTDKKMWDSMKRRIEITENIFDFKDLLLVYIWCVWWWWISYLFVDNIKQNDVKNYLILLTIIAVISLIILFILKKYKKDFNKTIIEDMNEIEK